MHAQRAKFFFSFVVVRLQRLFTFTSYLKKNIEIIFLLEVKELSKISQKIYSELEELDGFHGLSWNPRGGYVLEVIRLNHGLSNE